MHLKGVARKRQGMSLAGSISDERAGARGRQEPQRRRPALLGEGWGELG